MNENAKGSSSRPRSGDEALERLLEGNARFAADRKLNQGQDTIRRREVAAGQEPFAVVLGCADSRVPVEVVFDTGLGDLFVVRVAGNIAVDQVVLGSVEFALTQLDSPLVVVLGHEDCGAVRGAVEAAAEGATPPGALGAVISPIVPVVERIARDAPGLPHADLLDRSVRANVAAAVADLAARSPVIAERVESGAVRAAGAVYRLESGEVELV